MAMASFLPCMSWLKTYNKNTFIDDGIAAVVITMVMIPQSLAYALLAGLPPQLGLYASILPLLVYALLGGSSALSVGPFAISSILTATALNAVFADSSTAELMAGAVVLAFSSGIFLVLFGFLRLGFLNNFLSFPVITGFISASAVVIASSQIGNLLGIHSAGGDVFNLIRSLNEQWSHINATTLNIGISSLIFLMAFPRAVKLFTANTAYKNTGEIFAKIAPVLVIVMAIMSAEFFHVERQGVAVIGDIPRGLPSLQLPSVGAFDWPLETWKSLIISSVLISIIGFVSAVSVAQSFAVKRRQRIDPNQEAIALGMANLGAGFSAAFPIAASLSRSAVSFNAGAKTPAAGAFTAFGIMLATLFLTPLLYHLPIATLAALILSAIISLVDIAAMKRIWRYSHKDFSAMALTAILTLSFGVETGLISGVILSIIWHLYWSSQPHSAVLGKLPNSEHFRNIERHKVELHHKLISFRFDASLYFANARFLEDRISQLLTQYPEAEHLVLMCASINDIDVSALESLFAIDERLQKAGITFHLSEVKGPVLDRLEKSQFSARLSGNIYISHYQAWLDLSAA